jgi:hypothetical protein
MSHDPNALDLATLVSSLWECGATVPMAIASRLVLAVAGAVEAHGTSAEVTLERTFVHEDGDVHLVRANGSEPAVCEPLVDVGIVAWELFVGRRFTLADVHPSGDVMGLVATCAKERSLGALERRSLSAIDPLVARTTAHDPSRRFPSLPAFARAFAEAMPPAGRFSLVAWLCAVTGPLPRAPFLTPRPPSVARVTRSVPRGTSPDRMLRELADLMPEPARTKVSHGQAPVIETSPWWTSSALTD